MISMNIYLIIQVRDGIKPDKTDKPGFQTGIYLMWTIVSAKPVTSPRNVQNNSNGLQLLLNTGSIEFIRFWNDESSFMKISETLSTG